MKGCHSSRQVDGTDHVLIASSFTVGVSLTPPLVMFAVQNSSTTWPDLRRADHLGASVLSQRHGELCRQLAGDKRTRLDGIDLTHAESGAILILGSVARFECRIADEHPAGDHTVVLLEILALQADKHADPLIFHDSRFRQLTA
jgi:flavin reductase (DIM6/NTAB) family NADH-FMN oxidoreductase RutF